MIGGFFFSVCRRCVRKRVGGFGSIRPIALKTPQFPLGPVSQFIDHHFRHFNAAALKDAADAYSRHLDEGGIMLMTLAGAMSMGCIFISFDSTRQIEIY